MLHYIVPVQAYLTFQDGSTKTGARGKPWVLKKLERRAYVDWGDFLGRGRRPRTPCVNFTWSKFAIQSRFYHWNFWS